jgi:quercetin dioxygenase-like cupin family protein
VEGHAGRVMVVRWEHAPLDPGWGEGVTARAVVGPAMGARHRGWFHLTVEAGGTLDARHASEAAFYVLAGRGWVQERGQASWPLAAGQMFLVDAGTRYRVQADASGPLVLLGGPCPPV